MCVCGGGGGGGSEGQDNVRSYVCRFLDKFVYLVPVTGRHTYRLT